MIDLAAAEEKGIAVCNVPGYSTAAVAQMTMALLLDIACSVSLLNGYLHAGLWQTPEDKQIASARLFELTGKTMGLVGFGAIGQQTARLAEAFGMHVVYTRRHPLPEDTPAAGYLTLERLLEESDIVSLHCPLTDETRGMIGEEALSHMRPGAVLLNTARGALIDSAAVARALDSGRLYAAGLDVLDEEPPGKDHPLVSHPRCIVTPHVAWAPVETRRRLIAACAENLCAFLAGEPKNLQRP